MLRNSVGNILSQGVIFIGPIPKLDGALCFDNFDIGPEAFFPEKTRLSAYNKRAKAMCKECPVIGECLEYALTNNIQEGIWGGTSLVDRRKIRRDRGLMRR
jgi:WhiB family transcriptional regulator, redox-sensing transcriptional regulator